jgi:hypothetical protein
MRPGGRPDEGETRRQGRLARRHLDERRTGKGPRIRVLFVESGKHLGKQCGIVDRARKDADMIERSRQ